MALTYIGETEFVQSGPPQWQQSMWDLDTLTIPYSGSQPNLDSFLNSLEKGSPSEIDGDMYLMDWRISGSKQYPQVDLLYSGKKNGDLPPGKNSQNDAVQSASSVRSASAILTQAMTITFYAPTVRLSYLSKGGIGTDVAADPDGNPRLINYSFFDTSFSITSAIESVIADFFIPQVITTFENEEVVPGVYWRNVSTKTKTYVPFVFDLSSGGYVYLYTLGMDYQVGDSLTISADGESATIAVDSVWQDGGILSYHQTANTFTASHVALPASGGFGHDAKFNVFIVP